MNDLVKWPPLRYHGGKWMLAPWVIAQFPPHRVYVEPYGGGASVLLRKKPCYPVITTMRDGYAVYRLDAPDAPTLPLFGE